MATTLWDTTGSEIVQALNVHGRSTVAGRNCRSAPFPHWSHACGRSRFSTVAFRSKRYPHIGQ